MVHSGGMTRLRKSFRGVSRDDTEYKTSKLQRSLRGFWTSLEKAGPPPTEITVFESDPECPPTVTVEFLVERFMELSHCSPYIPYIASVYIKRVKFSVTKSNAHRVVLAALLVAVKYQDDGFYGNNYYADLFGTALAEINRLEVALLREIDFNLAVPPYKETHDDCMMTRVKRLFTSMRRPVEA